MKSRPEGDKPPPPDFLSLVRRAITGAKRIASIAKAVEDKAKLVQNAAEKWNERKALCQCPLCAGAPADGAPFCTECLGKIAALGIKHADTEAVRDFFGKKG